MTAPTLVAETPTGEARVAVAWADWWSARVFVVAVVAALPLLLWFGRHHWFFLDEWWVLSRAGSSNPGYLDGHNGHWITLTRTHYLLTFELWGLRTYVPYQLPVVLAHLGAAALLREVARRCGVRGWIATATAVAFVFFGAGHENIVWGFQLTVTGSLVCGLALFLLADGPRALTRRDLLALAVGVLGLMTSSAFVGIVVGVGVMILLRRGVRIAGFYALPLAAIYAVWYARHGHDGAEPLRLAGRTLAFFGRMVWAIFDALAQGPIGVLLVVVAALGLAGVLRRAVRAGAWDEAALPVGLAAGYASFAVLTSLARAANPLTENLHASSRYVHIGAALLLPLVGAGAEELARRRTVLAAIALLPLAFGLPGNIDRFTDIHPAFRGGKETVLAMAHSPLIDDVPPDTTPFRAGGIEVPLTSGWLSRQAAAGRIPEPDGSDPVLGLTATSHVALTQGAGASDDPRCPPVTADVHLTLQRNDQLRFAGAIATSVTDGTHQSFPRTFLSRNGSAIRALAGPLDIVVWPVEGLPAQLCSPPA
jgi:hypothetical protein